MGCLGIAVCGSVGCFHTLTNCFQNLGTFFFQHLIMGGTNRINQRIQFTNPVIVELASSLNHSNQPNGIQCLMCFLIFRNTVKVIMQRFFKLHCLIEYCYLGLEKVFNAIAHGFFVIEKSILFFQHTLNQGNIVFLLRKYIVHQMNGFLHQCTIRVFMSVITGIQRSIVITLFTEFLSHKTNQTIFIIRHIHDVEILTEHCFYITHHRSRNGFTLANGSLSNLTLFAEHIRQFRVIRLNGIACILDSHFLRINQLCRNRSNVDFFPSIRNRTVFTLHICHRGRKFFRILHFQIFFHSRSSITVWLHARKCCYRTCQNCNNICITACIICNQVEFAIYMSNQIFKRLVNLTLGISGFDF